MKETTKRSILRWIHFVFGLTLIGYVYGPPAAVAQYAPFFRYVYMPVIILTGLWMWKGHWVKRLFSKA